MTQSFMVPQLWDPGGYGFFRCSVWAEMDGLASVIFTYDI